MCDPRCGHGPGDWANGCGPPAAAYRQGRRQEALCFALWRPSTGLKRKAAIVREIILPKRLQTHPDRQRRLHPRGCRQGDLGSLTAKRRPRVQAQPSCIRMARPEPPGRTGGAGCTGAAGKGHRAESGWHGQSARTDMGAQGFGTGYAVNPNCSGAKKSAWRGRIPTGSNATTGSCRHHPGVEP